MGTFPTNMFTNLKTTEIRHFEKMEKAGTENWWRSVQSNLENLGYGTNIFLKAWKFGKSLKLWHKATKKPLTPQHTDSHPCTRRPWGASSALLPIRYSIQIRPPPPCIGAGACQIGSSIRAWFWPPKVPQTDPCISLYPALSRPFFRVFFYCSELGKSQNAPICAPIGHPKLKHKIEGPNFYEKYANSKNVKNNLPQDPESSHKQNTLPNNYL